MEKDLQSFMSYRNNEQWMKNQSYKDLPEDEYRKTLLADVGFETGINLAIIKENSEKLIGDLYLKKENGIFWIGCTIHPNFARMGYAQQALTGLLHWLHTTQHCAQASAGAEPDNSASNNLLKKMGFHYCYYDAENNENIYIIDLSNLA
jgi:ribosomal-protein-alanine N-acetyltransferase